MLREFEKKKLSSVPFFFLSGYDGNARLNDMWSISLSMASVVGPVSPGTDANSTVTSAATQRVWEEVHYFGESPPTCCKYKRSGAVMVA